MKKYSINYDVNALSGVSVRDDIASRFGKCDNEFDINQPAVSIFKHGNEANLATWDSTEKRLNVIYAGNHRIDWSFHRSVLNAIVWHINETAWTSNQIISSERLFWAKLNELVKDGHIDKRLLSLISTNYAGPNRLCWSFKCKHDSMGERVQRYIHKNYDLGELPDSCYLVD